MEDLRDIYFSSNGLCDGTSACGSEGGGTPSNLDAFRDVNSGGGTSADNLLELLGLALNIDVKPNFVAGMLCRRFSSEEGFSPSVFRPLGALLEKFTWFLPAIAEISYIVRPITGVSAWFDVAWTSQRLIQAKQKMRVKIIIFKFFSTNYPNLGTYNLQRPRLYTGPLKTCLSGWESTNPTFMWTETY